MTRSPEARAGFTLTEVLMAMFVMAIGMISLLALFPVAFHNAKWALDTEQVARAAANSQAQTEIPRVTVFDAGPGFAPFVNNASQGIRNDDSYRPENGNTTLSWRLLATNADPADINALNTKLGRPVYLMLEVPPAGSGNIRWTFNTDTNLRIVGSNARVKLPPVFVDPFIASNPAFNSLRPFVTKNPSGGVNIAPGLAHHVGVNAKDDPGLVVAPFGFISNFATLLPHLTANTNPSLRPPWSIGIPRFSLSQYTTDFGALNLRLQTENSLGDEVNFATNGQPDVTAGQYNSQRRFTWAYMCQWPDYRMPDVCEVTAVVFNTRPTNGGLATVPPGETTYTGLPQVALDAGIEGAVNNFGRCFVKGLTQAAIRLPSSEPMAAKVGDWVMDNTFILPEFDAANPNFNAPFLDEYSPGPLLPINLRPGLAGGHFYKILDISAVRQVGGQFYQTLTLDRPAKSDGFTACMLAGIADVITKGVGRMPHR